MAVLLAAASVLAACAGSPEAAVGPPPTSPGTIAPIPVVTTPPAEPTPPSVPPTRPPSPSASPRPTTTTPRHTTSPSPKPKAAATKARPASVRYVTRVPIPRGCLTVSPAIVGIKVYLVQKALHLVGHKERYDTATVAAVKAFQSAHALPVTGVVDTLTWTALGTGYPFCVDRYTEQPAVPAGASASARIEAMIGYASGKLGLPYVWGGAGPMGFDCSGLDLQALYAGGVVVPGIGADRHVQADFATTKALYASSLPHVPFSQRRRGDLIFYGSPISHMAIYLGGGRILEAVRPVVRTASLWADGLTAQPYVLRPFPG